MAAAMDVDAALDRNSSTASGRLSGEGSPMTMSPWNQNTNKSNWFDDSAADSPDHVLIGSLVREEGHIYSLAATSDLLYTGSDSKNIRVWRHLKDFSGFKANSGLVKAIVLSNAKIFTGHQDGKIRVWKVSPKNPAIHKRCGTLPTLKDIFKSSINPTNYIETRHRRSLWIKHSDAVSCLSVNEDVGLLYSASWDRTLKVWRLSDSKCLESLNAHDDTVNSVVASVDGDSVFTGSADGTVKIWKREMKKKGTTKHTMDQVLFKHECAVTALTVSPDFSVLYCGTSDGMVNFWEIRNGLSHGGVLKGHRLSVLCLAAAGNLLFSGAADKMICVWRRDQGGETLHHTYLSVLTGHTGPVKCLAVEADRERGSEADPRWRVYSGSLDKSVKVWSVSEFEQEIDESDMDDEMSDMDDDMIEYDS